MKKTLIGILLTLCLVVGLLPVTALADNTATILIMGSEELTVTEGGDPVYTKNKEFDAANTADGSSTFKAWTQERCDGTSTWNLKFEWPAGGTPTVTLKDAKFDYYDNDTETYAYIDKGGDLISTANRTTDDLESNDNTANNLLVGAIMPVKGSNIDLKIVLKGSNLIETGSGFVLGNPSAKANLAEQNALTYNNVYFQNLTFVGEGENNTVANGGGIGIFSRSGYNVSFENVNLTISTTVKGSNAIPIHVTKGNLTINGGHINAKNLNNVAIWTKDGGDITINGDITVQAKMSSTSSASAIYAKNGSIIVNGGTIKGTGLNCPIFNAKTAITINGGDLNLVSAYYAIYPTPGASFTVNGGTVEVMAERAFFSGPTLGPNVKGFAGASAKSCEPYEESLKMKPWVILSDDESRLPEIEEEDIIIPTLTQPTQATTLATIPTVPTVPSTPDVSTKATQAATKATEAATKATEAATKATNAATKATNATTKATDATAATKATEATKATSATTATASATSTPTTATRPVSSKITRPAATTEATEATKATAATKATEATKATSAAEIPEETLVQAPDETLAPEETLAPDETLASEATEATEVTEATDPVDTPDATEAPEESDSTEATTSDKSDDDAGKKDKGPNVVLIIVLVVVVLAAGGGAAAYFFYFKKKK